MDAGPFAHPPAENCRYLRQDATNLALQFLAHQEIAFVGVAGASLISKDG
jgi:hypothetical protein